MSLTHDIAVEPAKAAETAALRRRASRALAFALASLAAMAFVIGYVGHEQPAYFWDWSAYFNRFKYYGSLFTTGGVSWLEVLLGSIRYSDYNLLGGIVFLIIVGVSLATLILDLLYPILDPRIHAHHS